MRVMMQTLLISIKLYWVHPKALVISFIVHPLILFLNILIFYTIFNHHGKSMIQGYSLAQMIWYFNVVHLITILIWNNTDRRLSGQILSGDLGNALIRPLSLFRFEFYNAITLRAGGLLFEVIPDFFIFLLIYPPVFLDLPSIFRFIPVVFLSFLIYFLISYLIGLSAVITHSNNSLRRIIFTAASLLGGGMIPLDFFPDTLRSLCDALPFKYVFYVPIQFFLNRDGIEGTELWLQTLGYQIVWIAVLFALCMAFWRLLMKRIVVVGG